jgi:hypothetical protein
LVRQAGRNNRFIDGEATREFSQPIAGHSPAAKDGPVPPVSQLMIFILQNY